MVLNNPRRGITLMITAMFVFAIQDGISRHLAETYNVMTVVMLRYWFFAIFAVAISMRHGSSLKQVAHSETPWLQIFRGVLLVFEIVVTVVAFVRLGLIETHAIFAIYPLMVAALAGPFLGEYVGWRRKVAICVGLVGVLIILRPGLKVFSPDALIPLLAAFMFAIYALTTRMVARKDSAATSFFYTGVAGAVAITMIAPFFWTPMQGSADWLWMLALCISGASGHFLLIKAYEATEAGNLQPFAYFQLVFVTIFGLTLFQERTDGWTVAGSILILTAGLFTLLRQARLK